MKNSLSWLLFFRSPACSSYSCLLSSRQEIMRPISRSLSDPHGYRALYFGVGSEEQEAEDQEVVFSDEEQVETPGSPRERSASK